MRTLRRGIAVAIVLVGAIAPARAQKATEQFIPIGQSPGISQKQTTISEIVDVDPRQRTLTITEGSARRTVKTTEKTRIFLDRSRLKQTNLEGSFADLQKGRRVEVKYLDPSRRDVADWVKVEIDR